ncbi:MAG: hypothetical protein KatS3mg103_0376 [Phycisphaerales bacterium]|nr:MAG: hypothetical protein KatS3mg103_0376 [Phycisphaerales bacterium]
MNTGRKKAELFAEVVAQYAPHRLGEPGLVDRMVDAFDRFMLQAVQDDPPPILPGVPRALQTLGRRGVQVGYVTGFATEPARRLLAARGLDLRRAHRQRTRCPRGRPAPDLILHAMDRLGLADPASVAYAGDTPVDVALRGLGRLRRGSTPWPAAPHTVQELHDAVRGTPARVAEDPRPRRGRPGPTGPAAQTSRQRRPPDRTLRGPTAPLALPPAASGPRTRAHARSPASKARQARTQPGTACLDQSVRMARWTGSMSRAAQAAGRSASPNRRKHLRRRICPARVMSSTDSAMVAVPLGRSMSG